MLHIHRPIHRITIIVRYYVPSISIHATSLLKLALSSRITYAFHHNNYNATSANLSHKDFSTILYLKRLPFFVKSSQIHYTMNFSSPFSKGLIILQPDHCKLIFILPIPISFWLSMPKVNCFIP